MQYFNQCVIPILTTAREAGPGGASLTQIGRRIPEIPCFEHVAWPTDGSLSQATVGAEFGNALLSLLATDFITISDPYLNPFTDATRQDAREDSGTIVTSENIEGYLRLILKREGPKRCADLQLRITPSILKDWEPPLSIGYEFVAFAKGREDEIVVQLSNSFFVAQNVLGFSLTELAQRTPNSQLVTPKYSKRKDVPFEVFVLMPFDTSFRKVYEDGISKAAHTIGLKCGRGDDFFGSEYVIDDIWSAILKAKFIVADCSGNNPNVLYELGVAHTVGKETLLITNNATGFPFDLRHWRYHLYTNDKSGIARLRETINKFLTRKAQ